MYTAVIQAGTTGGAKTLSSCHRSVVVGLPARPNSLAGAGTSDQEASGLEVDAAVAAAAAAGKVPEVDTVVAGV